MPLDGFSRKLRISWQKLDHYDSAKVVFFLVQLFVADLSEVVANSLDACST